MKNFVIVMGGAGCGKNHYIQHSSHLSKFLLVDIDAIKADALVKSPMQAMKSELEDAFKQGIDVVHPTVGGTVLGNVNKLRLAKSYGYTTDVVYLRGVAGRGIKNIQERAARGGHSVPDDKVVLTYKRAEAAYREIMDASDHWSIIHLD